MKEKTDRVFDAIFSFIEGLCKVLLLALVVICTGLFAGRYFFKITPAWGEPVAMLCLVWMCILSSSLAIRADDHLRVTMLDNILSKKALLALDVLSTVVIGLFAVFMIHAGSALVAFSSRNIVAGIGISFAWYNVSVPVTGVAYILALIDQWRKKVSAWKQKP